VIADARDVIESAGNLERWKIDEEVTETVISDLDHCHLRTFLELRVWAQRYDGREAEFLNRPIDFKTFGNQRGVLAELAIVWAAHAAYLQHGRPAISKKLMDSFGKTKTIHFGGLRGDVEVALQERSE
jgi:hypothetical protein